MTPDTPGLAAVAHVPLLFALAVLLAAALATISAWAPRRRPVKLVAVALFVLFVPVAYAAFVDLLSRPKPASAEWWAGRAEAATVLASRLAEDRAIYLWLALPEHEEPRAYVLPWSRSRAEELESATRAAEAQGGEVKMRRPFGPPQEPSLEDREPKFYPEPPPALPPKEPPPPPARVFQPVGLGL